MDQSYDSIVSMGEFRPMVVSPYMSPQLNETICGCRCGCGCGCAGDGNVDESERLSDSETAIDMSDSEDGETRPSTNHDSTHADDGVLSPRVVSRPMIIWLFDSHEDIQLGLPFEGSPRYNDQEGFTRAQALDTPGARSRSDAVASPGIVQTMSPGPGIGGWLRGTPERTRDEPDYRVYILTPLRLSAEYQHARGKMVEHMLIPDGAYFQVDKEQDWTRA